MKKFTYFDQGHRGALPPAVRHMISNADLSRATGQFVDAMTQIATDFHAAVDVDTMAGDDISRIPLKAPKLFGQNTHLTYVDSGTIASVYKITIGPATYALKINRLDRRVGHDLEVMHLCPQARHLVNKAYIGATFDVNGWTYSWVLSDFVSHDRSNGFDVAREKLYCAALTKGLMYADLLPANVKNGKIIDLGGLDRDDIYLKRRELDRVKKLVYFMRTENRVGFVRLLDQTVADMPAVLVYLVVNMGMLNIQMPYRFAPYRDIVKRVDQRIQAACARERGR